MGKIIHCATCKKDLTRDKDRYALFNWKPDVGNPKGMTINPRKDKPVGYSCGDCYQTKNNVN
jgi:hypothetical protein